MIFGILYPMKMDIIQEDVWYIYLHMSYNYQWPIFSAFDTIFNAKNFNGKYFLWHFNRFLLFYEYKNIKKKWNNPNLMNVCQQVFSLLQCVHQHRKKKQNTKKTKAIPISLHQIQILNSFIWLFFFFSFLFFSSWLPWMITLDNLI